ncbi:PREDICTED: putative clathrin assembly protein At4g40080 [Nelumbo nucifera]|uniref:ENTH domain-containing protein n=2 Tax=Nelumbo nucifera TaxID=4432 RepID=A0A822ZD96_NELNU|nr:PREDICTED: putative clathrin assembly protein At4g40080 [Nelumbo nucifera]DAD41006.1 TPA_asm: hypothetical protein HUJ06_015329 [Nelumbo nucifera]
MGRRTKLRDIVGALKDKASISKAALLSKPNTTALHLAVLRATTHEPSSPPHEKHIAAVLAFGHSSRPTASLCIITLMDRLQNTHNSSVALKCLITVHNIIRRGTFILQDQLSIYPSSGGRNYLNLSNFRDYANSETWELSSWVRWYARVLEQLIFTCRILGGFFLSSSTLGVGEKDVSEEEEEKVSSLLNGDLIKEIDAFVGAVEEMCKAPDPVHAQSNKLVYEVMKLIADDYQSAQKEITLRIYELRERLSSLSFGESVELVCVLRRMENCKERLSLQFLNNKTTAAELLWGLIREVKDRIGTTKDSEAGVRPETVERRLMVSESARLGERVLRSGDSVRFSSGRLELNRVSKTILESVV